MNISSVNSNIEALRQKEIADAAFQRGDVGRAAKEQYKVEVVSSDDLPKVVKYEQLSEGKTRTEFADGRCVTQAPNGMIKEDCCDGTMKISLPNGILIQRDADGKTLAYDPTPGKFLDVVAYKESEHGQLKFKFKDSDGNNFLVTSKTLRFEVTNPTKTLTEKVASTGDIHIQTKTLARTPSGKFGQDEERIFVETNGKVHEYGSYIDDVHVDNKQVQFTQRDDIHTTLHLPYEIPYAISCPGEHTPGPVHPAPSPAPAPAPAPNPPPAPPCPPGTLPPVFPTPSPSPSPADPYAPVSTASGVIKQVNPDNSMFISLPNGIVLHQDAQGKAQVFDARDDKKIIPVQVKDITTPGSGAEQEFSFVDVAGNSYKLFSKSQDFSVESADKKVLQGVFPNGDIMIMAKTGGKESGAKAALKEHKVLIDANGRVNTYGESGVSVGYNQIAFADGCLSLPYAIPPFQGLFGGLLPVQPPPFTTGPVSGTFPQGFTPAQPQAPAQGQQPVHKGVMHKMKEFFTGEGEAQYAAGSAYPYAAYNAMNNMLMTQTLLATTMSMTMMPFMMTPFYRPFPMAMFFNPFMMW